MAATTPILVTLSVNRDSPHVYARLEFINASTEEAFIEKYNACVDGNIENDVFEIQTNGRRLNYKGLLYKRRRPTREDYVSIKPQRKISTRVDLAIAYDFPRGRHEYVVTYSALVSFPDRDDFAALMSNPVRVSG